MRKRMSELPIGTKVRIATMLDGLDGEIVGDTTRYFEDGTVFWKRRLVRVEYPKSGHVEELDLSDREVEVIECA